MTAGGVIFALIYHGLCFAMVCAGGIMLTAIFFPIGLPLWIIAMIMVYKCATADIRFQMSQ